VKDPGFLGGSEARSMSPGGRRIGAHGSPEEVPR
jgi:hypothetical protein